MLLATALEIPPNERELFLRVARAEQAPDYLSAPADALPSLPRAAEALPVGTVTFLFTDIEGRTRLWEHHPTVMPAALARYDALLAELAPGIPDPPAEHSEHQQVLQEGIISASVAARSAGMIGRSFRSCSVL